MTDQGQVERDAAGLDMPDSGGWLAKLIGSPLLWGGLATVGFYSIIDDLPVASDLAVRYFTGHPLEYVTTALFFVGLAILIRQAVLSLLEPAPLALEMAGGVSETGEAVECASGLLEQVQSMPPRRRRGQAVERLFDLCGFVLKRRCARGIEDHARYLADRAAERMDDRYALVRTIAWAVPILGFLGTVIGITMAVANVTPEQLESSLQDVTDGLAVAFDTTALALALSLVLAFALYSVQRIERRTLERVEIWSIRQVVPLLLDPAAEAGPLAAAEARVAAELLDRSEDHIRRQSELWEQALESLRQRWVTTLDDQSRRLTESLDDGVSTTIVNHRQQLLDLRVEWLATCRELTNKMTGATTDLQSDLDGHVDRVVASLESRVDQWVETLAGTSMSVAGQAERMTVQAELLLKLVERTEQLAGIESRLADNLEAVRTSQAFEQTLHSLTAAVHLLTARAGSQAA